MRERMRLHLPVPAPVRGNVAVVPFNGIGYWPPNPPLPSQLRGDIDAAQYRHHFIGAAPDVTSALKGCPIVSCSLRGSESNFEFNGATSVLLAHQFTQGRT